MKILRSFFVLGLLLILILFVSEITQNTELEEFSSTETYATATQKIQKKPRISPNIVTPSQPKISSRPQTPTQKTVPSLPAVSGMGEAFNQQLIVLANEERLKAGLDVLTPNSALTKAAQLKVADMVQNNYFAHTSPSGKTAAQFRIEGGYNGFLTGENLAVLFKTAPEIMAAWMNSPTHKANILQGQYKDVGVATAFTVYKGKNTFFVAMILGGAIEKVYHFPF